MRAKDRNEGVARRLAVHLRKRQIQCATNVRASGSSVHRKIENRRQYRKRNVSFPILCRK